MKSSSKCPTERFLQMPVNLSCSLSLSISVHGSWETECARSYAARMRALSPPHPTPHSAWSYGSLSLSSASSSSSSFFSTTTARQRSLTVEDETGSRQPRGTFL